MRHAVCLTLTSLVLFSACDGARPAGPDADWNVAERPGEALAFATDASPAGASMTDWSVAWWRWELAAPTPVNPSLDPTGANCAQGQDSDRVWFLASTFRSGAVTRACTVPLGSFLLVPLSALLNDYPCPDPSFQPAPGQSLEDFLTEGARQFQDAVNELSLSVDGVAVPGLFEYRFTTPLFQFTGDPSLRTSVDGCITGTPQPGVSDGYFVMLKPLAPGTHSVVFGGANTHGFRSSITYNLTVSRD